MNIQRGSPWGAWDEADLFLISVPGTLTEQGKLVMAQGVALETKRRFKGVDKALGDFILHHAYDTGDREYSFGLIVSPEWPRGKLGVFQLKLGWRESDDSVFIQNAVFMLQGWCDHHPSASVHLVLPAYLDCAFMMHILEDYLTEKNVTVWFS